MTIRGRSDLIVLKASYHIDGKVLLDQLDHRFHGGQKTLLLGGNGAGKSLSLRLLYALIVPSKGRVYYADGGRPRQAMVFQKPLMLQRSVWDNMAYVMDLYHCDKGWVQEALRKTGLWPERHAFAPILSAGQQQCLALARAWAIRPEALFLDEPTANLDPISAKKVEGIIGNIAQEGCTVIMTSHNLAQARRLADHVVFVQDGRFIEHGTVSAFFRRPKTDSARAFIADQWPK